MNSNSFQLSGGGLFLLPLPSIRNRFKLHATQNPGYNIYQTEPNTGITNKWKGLDQCTVQYSTYVDFRMYLHSLPIQIGNHKRFCMIQK